MSDFTARARRAILESISPRSDASPSQLSSLHLAQSTAQVVAAASEPSPLSDSGGSYRNVMTSAIDAIAALPPVAAAKRVVLTPATTTTPLPLARPTPTPVTPEETLHRDENGSALARLMMSSASVRANESGSTPLQSDDLATPLSFSPRTTLQAASPSPRASASLAGSPTTTANVLLERLSERMRGLPDIKASLAASSARLDAATEGLTSFRSFSSLAASSSSFSRMGSIGGGGGGPLSPTIAFSFLPPPPPFSPPRTVLSPTGTTPTAANIDNIDSSGGGNTGRSPLGRPAAAAAAAATAAAFAAAAAVIDRAIVDSDNKSESFLRTSASAVGSPAPLSPPPTSRYGNFIAQRSTAAAVMASPLMQNLRNGGSTSSGNISPAVPGISVSPVISPRRPTTTNQSYTPPYSPATTWFFVKDPENAYLDPNFQARSGVPLPMLVRVN